MSAMVFSTDNESLITVSPEGIVSKINIKTGDKNELAEDAALSSVSFCSDGDRVVSVDTDNSLNLSDAETGTKIASFISFDDGEWITITADGYYNASPRGDERLDVRIGGKIYGMDQFSAVFFQAEVLSARLQGLPDPAFIAKVENRLMDLIPPAITVNAPSESNTGRAEIGISINDHFHPLNTIQIVINGRLLGPEELELCKSDAKLRIDNTSIVIENSIKELACSIPVNLETGSNRIQIIATNKGAQSKTGAERRTLFHIVNNSEAATPVPNLWVLAIGSNRPLYGRNESRLKFAVNNAQGIKTLFEAQRGYYRNVYTHLIIDEDETLLTREHIVNTIVEFFGMAQSNDVLVLFMSGHGENRNGDGYYFLPQAITLDDIAVISNMPGRKFIFIDSCFSGGVDDMELARNLKNQSTVIFTSSQKDERSWEGSGAFSSYGFFTEALISGIDGGAEINNEVRLHKLKDHVSKMVELHSDEKQHPYVYIPDGFWGFVLAEVGSGE
jgi:hypothetical protein